jgi:ribonucleotide reductase beta subunit family protein with ferritin-like domain
MPRKKRNQKRPKKTVQVEVQEEKKESYSLMGGHLDSKSYSFFHNPDDTAWYFYSAQQVQMWSAGEIEYHKDMECFKNLSPRLRLLFEEILGFFAPGDGLVNASILRQMQSAKNSMEASFLAFQMADECVHAETYGRFIKMFSRTPKEEERIFSMVDNIECVKMKADFIKKYIDSDIHVSLRCLAQACAEGIFFVTLFSIIFFFRSKGIMEAFIFANEQISKDECLHRDYYLAKAEEYGIGDHPDEAKEIVQEALGIEKVYIEYLLRTPIQEGDMDKEMGLTVENLAEYSKLLADQIFVFCGLETVYNSKPSLPWMKDLGLQKKSNFYERSVGNYKKGSLAKQLDWKASIGMSDENVKTGVINPEEIDF